MPVAMSSSFTCCCVRTRLVPRKQGDLSRGREGQRRHAARSNLRDAAMRLPGSQSATILVIGVTSGSEPRRHPAPPATAPMTWFQRLLLITHRRHVRARGRSAAPSARPTPASAAPTGRPATASSSRKAEKHTLIEFSHRTSGGRRRRPVPGRHLLRLQDRAKQPARLLAGLHGWRPAPLADHPRRHHREEGTARRRSSPLHLATAMTFMGVLIVTLHHLDDARARVLRVPPSPPIRRSIGSRS